MRVPVLVVRPSGVWNSRAPLHNLIRHLREVDRDYAVLTMAVANVRYRLAHRSPTDRTSARKYLTKGAGPVANKAWHRYRKAWQSLSSSYERQPSLEDFDHDLATGIYAVRAFAVGRYSALFETFVQCWALNMLLAILEAGRELSVSERELVDQFSPFRRRFLIPPVATILAAFPTVDEELGRMPHVYTDPATGEALDELPHDGISARTVVLFWRDFRNSVVHQGGMISHSFRNEHADVFEAIRKPYADKLRPLQAGSRLQLPDVVLPAIATTHSRCASWMNSELQRVSTSRGRVQPADSNLPEPVRFDNSITAAPLLMDGDHADSLRWLQDKEWRNQLLLRIPRRWRTPVATGA